MADGPTTEDALGRKVLARRLAELFASPEHATPCTLALWGDWGSGKSSVMEMLKEVLQLSEKEKDAKFRFRIAHFNVWEYEHTDNIAAGLAQETIRGLTGEFCWFCKQWLRVRLAMSAHGYRFYWLVLKLLFVLAIPASLLYFQAWNGEGGGDGKVWALGGLGFTVYFFVQFVWQDLKTLWRHPLALELLTYMNLPDYGEHLGLIPEIKRHIQALCELCGVEKNKATHRFIVFVDDLDRCQPSVINKTLDALRLIMDLPNVIVVLAIDPRIAYRAVASNYKDVASEDRDVNAIARDYLGKLIQLSVCLHPAED